MQKRNSQSVCKWKIYPFGARKIGLESFRTFGTFQTDWRFLAPDRPFISLPSFITIQFWWCLQDLDLTSHDQKEPLDTSTFSRWWRRLIFTHNYEQPFLWKLRKIILFLPSMHFPSLHLHEGGMGSRNSALASMNIFWFDRTLLYLLPIDIIS